MKQSFLLVASLLAVVSAATPAGATENFPPAIAAHLQLSGPPACTLCHASLAGGRGTVVTPFGNAMRSRGLQAYDEASLKTALDALSGANTDGDGDGTGDIAELKAGADPNAGANDEVVEPGYGCAVAARAHGAVAPDAVMAGALTALALVVARGRRRVRR